MLTTFIRQLIPPKTDPTRAKQLMETPLVPMMVITLRSLVMRFVNVVMLDRTTEHLYLTAMKTRNHDQPS